MTQKKALKILAIIFVLSISLLLFNFVFQKIKPEVYLEGKRQTPQELAQAKKALLDDLNLGNNERSIAKRSDRGIITWPEESMVPDFHKADLSIYRGLEKSAHFLKGIVIFIDAGEVVEEEIRVEATTTEAEETGGIRPAATDPVTGLPVPREPLNKEEKTTEEPKVEIIAVGEILDTLTLKLKEKLEAVGAKVYLTREMSGSDTEISQQAVVGKVILERFLQELDEQKFKSTAMEALLPKVKGAMDDSSSDESRLLFTARGVNPDLRMLLDTERQYKDVLLLSLRLGDSEEEDERGIHITYYGNSVAATFGTSSLENDNEKDNPAYVAYDASSRRRLGEKIERNIRTYLEDMTYRGKRDAVSESAVISGRYNNVTAVELTIGERNQVKDVEFLAVENNLKKLAEAIAVSCFEFYSDK